MIEASTLRRAGTPDEVGTVDALLMGRGSFVTRSDFLIDGRVPAAYLVRRTLGDARRSWERSNELRSVRLELLPVRSGSE
jgi:hypothetical protein